MKNINVFLFEKLKLNKNTTIIHKTLDNLTNDNIVIYDSAIYKKYSDEVEHEHWDRFMISIDQIVHDKDFKGFFILTDKGLSEYRNEEIKKLGDDFIYQIGIYLDEFIPNIISDYSYDNFKIILKGGHLEITIMNNKQNKYFIYCLNNQSTFNELVKWWSGDIENLDYLFDEESLLPLTKSYFNK